MLELKNISKKFNLTNQKVDERIALDNVSLTIESGEFVTIIGGNGSGKSTTMNIISGALKPDSGSILLNGVDITKKNEYQRAAYFGRVFQDPMMGTCGDMSVLENLEIAFRRGQIHLPFKWGFSKSHKEIFIKELKRFNLGLETRLNQKVGVMSGGQRQALTLLMATLTKRPSYRAIKRDYILFSEQDHHRAAQLFDYGYQMAKRDYKKRKKDLLKSKKYKGKEKRIKLKELWIFADTEIRKFDLTKQILLLDEHTAALDPKTAKKVLELTSKIVKENQMTTLMVTHNMKDAITYGDRLIMFHSGHIIYDVKGEEKRNLKVEDLLRKFDEADEKIEKD